MEIKMEYTRSATVPAPALIIYLIDASHSMNDFCETMTRMEIVNEGLKGAR